MPASVLIPDRGPVRPSMYWMPAATLRTGDWARSLSVPDLVERHDT